MKMFKNSNNLPGAPEDGDRAERESRNPPHREEARSVSRWARVQDEVERRQMLRLRLLVVRHELRGPLLVIAIGKDVGESEPEGESLHGVHALT